MTDKRRTGRAVIDKERRLARVVVACSVLPVLVVLALLIVFVVTTLGS